MAKRDYAKGAIPFAFVALPKDVLVSPEFAQLGSSAKALMLDLAAQYTGRNNGRLNSSLEALKSRGWASRPTLIRARDELIETEFAIRTRVGHPPRTSEWFGFTWWKLDWEKTMDIGPKSWPYLVFVKTIPVVQKQHRWTPKSAPGGAETAPIDGLQTGPSVQKQHHATEVKAEKAIGAETAPVLELAISAASSPARPTLVAVGGRPC